MGSTSEALSPRRRLGKGKAPGSKEEEIEAFFHNLVDELILRTEPIIHAYDRHEACAYTCRHSQGACSFSYDIYKMGVISSSTSPSCIRVASSSP